MSEGWGTMPSQGRAIDWALRQGLVERLVRIASRRTVLDRLAALLLVATVLFFAAFSLARPDNNWDMLAYVASALEDRAADASDLHARAWAAIEASSTEEQLEALKFGHPYNQHQWENPSDFQSQLSMYRVKVAYVALLRALEPITGLAAGAHLLSIAPALAFGFFALYWLWREQALQGAFLFAPIMVIADFGRMTASASPDMLAAAVSAPGLYLLLKGRDWTGSAVLFASVFVRPDNLILIFALLIAAFAFGWRKAPYVALFAAAFAACMAISHFGGHPGWWPHFYFSTVHIQNSMAGFDPAFSLPDFVRGYTRGIVFSLTDNDWPYLLALLLAAWAMLGRAGRLSGGRAEALIFALAIGAFGKFASFPLPDDRFYFIFVAGLSLMVATVWKPRFDATVRS